MESIHSSSLNLSGILTVDRGSATQNCENPPQPERVSKPILMRFLQYRCCPLMHSVHASTTELSTVSEGSIVYSLRQDLAAGIQPTRSPTLKPVTALPIFSTMPTADILLEWSADNGASQRWTYVRDQGNKVSGQLLHGP